MATPTLNFIDGKSIPCIGLGTWKSKPGEVGQAIRTALENDYRHFDCAFNYGNESEIGEVFKEKLENGSIEREDLFITTKLWCTHHRPEMVEEGCRISIDRLGVGYIDLYLMHWPMAFKEGDELFPSDEDGKMLMMDVDYVETWKAMQPLIEKGMVRSLGVSNFNSKQLQRILDLKTKYPVVCNQVILRWGIQRGYCLVPKSVSSSRQRENINVFDFNLTDEEVLKINGLRCDDRRVCAFFTPMHSPYYPFHEEF